MNNQVWMKNYIKLKNFLAEKKRYPNIKSKDENEKALSEFVKQQREEYINYEIENFKEKLLNDIHFYWGFDRVANDNSIETWKNFENNYIQKLIAHNGSKFNKNGEYKTNKLIDWETIQKMEDKFGTLDEDLKYELEKIGFYFDESKTPMNQRRSNWFKNYNKLIALLKTVNGDYSRLKTLNEFKDISKWVSTQLQEEKNGSLEDYKRILLENISFPFEAIWNDEI